MVNYFRVQVFKLNIKAMLYSCMMSNYIIYSGKLINVDLIK